MLLLDISQYRVACIRHHKLKNHPLIAEDTLKMVESMAVSLRKTSWSMEAGRRNWRVLISEPPHPPISIMKPFKHLNTSSALPLEVIVNGTDFLKVEGLVLESTPPSQTPGHSHLFSHMMPKQKGDSKACDVIETGRLQHISQSHYYWVSR